MQIGLKQHGKEDKHGPKHVPNEQKPKMRASFVLFRSHPFERGKDIYLFEQPGPFEVPLRGLSCLPGHGSLGEEVWRGPLQELHRFL